MHYEFLKTDQSVNKNNYYSALLCLREEIHRKVPEMQRENSWVLQHDNVPSHGAIIIHELLPKHSTNTAPQA